RFSEDLDFTAKDKTFALKQKTIKNITKTVTENTGIQFSAKKIKPLLSKEKPKGFQVNIHYWGANHSKNQRPLPSHRWQTKIKLEIITDEVVLMPIENRQIYHPYSDVLTGNSKCYCYHISEVVSEKLRALKQRSYTAPRDFYDLYYLTENWEK